MAREWKASDIEFIKKNVKTFGVRGLTRELDIPASSLRRKIKELGLEQNTDLEPQNPFTVKMDEQLQHRYQVLGQTQSAIAQALGVSVQCVNRRVRALGYKKFGLKKHGIEWSANEIDYLTTHYNQLGAPSVAAELDRTEHSVRKKADELNIGERHVTADTLDGSLSCFLQGLTIERMLPRVPLNQVLDNADEFRFYLSQIFEYQKSISLGLPMEFPDSVPAKLLVPDGLRVARGRKNIRAIMKLLNNDRAVVRHNVWLGFDESEFAWGYTPVRVMNPALPFNVVIPAWVLAQRIIKRDLSSLLDSTSATKPAFNSPQQGKVIPQDSISRIIKEQSNNTLQLVNNGYSSAEKPVVVKVLNHNLKHPCNYVVFSSHTNAIRRGCYQKVAIRLQNGKKPRFPYFEYLDDIRHLLTQ